MSHSNYRLDESVTYLVNRASRTIRKRLLSDFQKAGFNITSEQWSIMIHLWVRDGYCLYELAEMLYKDKTTMTRLVNEIEKKNLIIRVPGVEDRRQKHIFLTDTGKELQKHLVAIAQNILKEIDRKIGKENITVCKKVLRDIHSLLADK